MPPNLTAVKQDPICEPAASAQSLQKSVVLDTRTQTIGSRRTSVASQLKSSLMSECVVTFLYPRLEGGIRAAAQRHHSKRRITDVVDRIVRKDDGQWLRRYVLMQRDAFISCKSSDLHSIDRLSVTSEKFKFR